MSGVSGGMSIPYPWEFFNNGVKEISTLGENVKSTEVSEKKIRNFLF